MKLPQILALVMILSTMLGAGLAVDRQRLTETLRDYGLLSRGLIANFILVPLFAYVLVGLFHVRTDVSIGILLMSMAPGVPFLVNSAGRKQGGSLAFAITIAFLFSALSVITIPITASLLLPHGSAHVPAQKFLTTLIAFQLVPLVIGALIAPRLDASTVERVSKALRLIFFVAVLGFVVVIFPKLVSSVASVYGLGHLAIIAAIGLFSAGIGWLLGGKDRQYRRTLSIATLLRNIGLCVLIGTGSFAEDTLVVPTIFAYFIITFCLSLPFRAFYQRTAQLPSRAASG